MVYEDSDKFRFIACINSKLYHPFHQGIETSFSKRPVPRTGATETKLMFESWNFWFKHCSRSDWPLLRHRKQSNAWKEGEKGGGGLKFRINRRKSLKIRSDNDIQLSNTEPRQLVWSCSRLMTQEEVSCLRLAVFWNLLGLIYTEVKQATNIIIFNPGLSVARMAEVHSETINRAGWHIKPLIFTTKSTICDHVKKVHLIKGCGTICNKSVASWFFDVQE